METGELNDVAALGDRRDAGGRLDRGVQPRRDDVVTLADDGIGIPSIVKTLVDLHGGSIAVESAEGTGTTVRVSLPPVTTGR